MKILRMINLLGIVLLFILPSSANAENFTDGLTIPLSSEWQEQEKNNNDHVDYEGYSSELGLHVRVMKNRTLQTNITNNYDRLSLNNLSQLAKKTIEQSKNDDNVKIDDYEIIQSEQLTFLRFDGTYKVEKGIEGEAEDYFLQYVTVANGGMLQLNFSKSGAPLSDAEKTYLETSIIDKVQYKTLTNRHIDTDILIKIAGVGFVVVLLLGSVVVHLLYVRKKMTFVSM